MKLYGEEWDEINQTAREILSTLEELGVDDRLAILGLCRSIVALSTDSELDMACIYIDRISERLVVNEETI